MPPDHRSTEAPGRSRWADLAAFPHAACTELLAAFLHPPARQQSHVPVAARCGISLILKVQHAWQPRSPRLLSSIRSASTRTSISTEPTPNLARSRVQLEYLGVKNIRDSAEAAPTLRPGCRSSQATGVKFDDYIAETSQAGMQTDLGFVHAAREGRHPERPSRAATRRTTPTRVARQHAGGHRAVPAAALCAGPGARPAGHQHELRLRLDRGEQLGRRLRHGRQPGGLCTDANAHTYPNAGQLPDAAIQSSTPWPRWRLPAGR